MKIFTIERTFGALILALLAWVAWDRRAGLPPIWISLPLAGLAAWGLYHFSTRRARKRARLRRLPFPPQWEAVLQRDVVFFRTLDADAQQRFRQDIQVFLGETQVTGVDTEVDDTIRVLTAASAVIPIFGFPDWHWNQIKEVLIYPSRFNDGYEFQDASGRQILGMVGSGAMSRMMILSKTDLLNGFRNSNDRHNVGLHEFAHLVDKSDGIIDGIPGVGLDSRSVGPWIELVRREMEEMAQGRSDLNPYGLTNEAEFFAVASEYFFERPGLLLQKHPELYTMLSRVFRQDLRSRAKAMLDAALHRKRRFGRNSPCFCGSGRKYKKCCLRRLQRSRS